MKFKVGDRVRVVADDDSNYGKHLPPVGSDIYGTVVQVGYPEYPDDANSDNYIIVWDDDTYNNNSRTNQGVMGYRFAKVEPSVRRTIEYTVANAIANYSVFNLQDALVADLVDNLNACHNIK